MTWIKFVLMLYFFMVAHKATCQTQLKAFLKSRRLGRGLAGAGDISHIESEKYRYGKEDAPALHESPSYG